MIVLRVGIYYLRQTRFMRLPRYAVNQLSAGCYTPCFVASPVVALPTTYTTIERQFRGDHFDPLNYRLPPHAGTSQANSPQAVPRDRPLPSNDIANFPTNEPWRRRTPVDLLAAG